MKRERPSKQAMEKYKYLFTMEYDFYDFAKNLFESNYQAMQKHISLQKENHNKKRDLLSNESTT